MGKFKVFLGIQDKYAQGLEENLNAVKVEMFTRLRSCMIESIIHQGVAVLLIITTMVCMRVGITEPEHVWVPLLFSVLSGLVLTGSSCWLLIGTLRSSKPDKIVTKITDEALAMLRSDGYEIRNAETCLQKIALDIRDQEKHDCNAGFLRTKGQIFHSIFKSAGVISRPYGDYFKD